MPKLKPNALVAFRKDYAAMVARFRQDLDAPFALIGKATDALIRAGRPITVETLVAQIANMTDDRNRPAVERAIQQIRHLPPAG